MRKLYTYEFATYMDGTWQTIIRADGLFRRTPRSIVRGLLEQWIVSHQHELTGGRVLVCDGRRVAEPATGATVRVRLHLGGLDHHDPEPVATAYLTHLETDDAEAWAA